VCVDSGCKWQSFCRLLQFRIFTAPFHYVGFADFWLADQLNSLTTVLLDLEYLVCFYSIEVNWLGYTGSQFPYTVSVLLYNCTVHHNANVT